VWRLGREGRKKIENIINVQNFNEHKIKYVHHKRIKRALHAPSHVHHIITSQAHHSICISVILRATLTLDECHLPVDLYI
jgi:hypothetical protein